MSWMDDEIRRQMLFNDSLRKSLALDSSIASIASAAAVASTTSKDLLSVTASIASTDLLKIAETTRSIQALTAQPSYVQDLINQKTAVASLVAQPTSLDYMRKIPEASVIASQTTAYWEQNKHLFQKPDVSQLSELAKGVFAVRADIASISDTVTAMSRLQSPWLDKRNPVVSVSSFASIHEIGFGVNRTPFQPEFTSTLRAQLGDWREVHEIPPAVLEDPAERTEFYLERGFRAQLVDFPPEALEEIIENAGLAAPDDEENLAWRDRVSPYVGRIESGLRRYVNAVMTDAFGERWTKRIHPDIVKRWSETKQKRVAEGRPELPHLIYYSELSDLQEIMQPRDHFVYFKPKFQRVESMQEIFRRVLPARNAVAHVGIVTPIDYFTVMTEFARLRHVIDSDE